MNLVALMARHGYALIFAVLLIESVGLPFPAAIALVAAGAAVAVHALWGPYILFAAITALLLGDIYSVLAGTIHGLGAAGISLPRLHQSRNLHSALGRIVLQTRQAHAHHFEIHPRCKHNGRAASRQHKNALLAVSPSRLSGSSGLFPYISRSRISFSRLFSRSPAWLSCRRISHGSRGARGIGGLCDLPRHSIRKNTMYRVVPRVQVEELAKRLASEHADRVLIVDVRSHGYYDSGAARIKNSIRIEPNNLEEEIKSLPKDKDIYLYCT